MSIFDDDAVLLLIRGATLEIEGRRLDRVGIVFVIEDVVDGCIVATLTVIAFDYGVYEVGLCPAGYRAVVAVRESHPVEGCHTLCFGSFH